MQKIINEQDNYFQEPQNAIITIHGMIPGINGKRINLEKSYQKMKKLDFFQPSLLVFDEIKPSITIENHYNKVIISGNKKIKQISLVIKIDNDDLFTKINQILKNNQTIANILSSKKYNLNNSFFINSLNYQYSDSIDYCLTYYLQVSRECMNNHMYTILGNTTIKNFYLTKTKEQINNGTILIYEFDNNSYSNLNIIIKYLKSNNYNIVSIDELTSLK